MLTVSVAVSRNTFANSYRFLHRQATTSHAFLHNMLTVKMHPVFSLKKRVNRDHLIN